MDTVRMMNGGDFAVVTTDSLKHFKLNQNDIVYIGGAQPYPEDPDDPYWLRLKMLVVRMNDGHVMSDTNMLVVDPSNLELVDEELHTELAEILAEDFEKPEEEGVVAD